SSGLASILNATTTLWTAVLIFWVVPSERPSAVNYLGVLIGFGGVVVLVYPELSAHGISGSFLGALAVLVASLSYAINALYPRRRLQCSGSPLSASSGSRCPPSSAWPWSSRASS